MASLFNVSTQELRGSYVFGSRSNETNNVIIMVNI